LLEVKLVCLSYACCPLDKNDTSLAGTTTSFKRLTLMLHIQEIRSIVTYTYTRFCTIRYCAHDRVQSKIDDLYLCINILLWYLATPNDVNEKRVRVPTYVNK